MGQLYYNRLTNNRIKSIALGLILIAANSLMIYIVALRTADGKPTNTFFTVLLAFIISGLVLIVGLIPFGQVIESHDRNEFTTYYRLGRLKFKQQNWDKADNLSLEQDQRRYYCLTIKTANGQILQMEKYPTLDQADERLKEFKKIFD